MKSEVFFGFSIKDKTLLRIIGDNNSVIQRILTKLSVLDAPEAVWESRDLEKLYYDARKMFELEDRFDTLKFKIDFIQNNMKLLIDLRETKKDHMLEITIVALIAFEVMLFLYDLFGH